MRIQMLTAALALGVLSGCGADQTAEDETKDKDKTNNAGVSMLPGGVVIPGASTPAGGGSSNTGQPAPLPNVERVEAKAGVGIKGQGLNQEHINQTIAAPVKSLFAFEQKAVFDFQIKPTLELYKATNGNYPKTHEEFMTKIIQQNQIKLPELPPGERYVWDPQQAQLMVERPAPQ